MEHDLNLTLKMYKSAFSVEKIIEIKKKMHIDPIFTYSDSEIALKVCRNKQRFKLKFVGRCVGSINYVTRKISVLIENNPIITYLLQKNT